MKTIALLTLLSICSAEENFLIGNNSTLEGDDGKIVGGQKARRGQFPYQVAMYLYTQDQSSSKCGGSLITRQWILTAAHCTIGRVRATVYMGTINLMRLDASTQIQNVPENGLRTHPGYDSRSRVNDIALVRLTTPAQMNKYVGTVRLAISSDDTYENQITTASGFGKTGDSSRTNELYYVNLRVMDNNQCSKYYSPGLIDKSRLCTSSGTKDNPKQTCQGDSGGPLVLANNTMQIGLTSFGYQSCEQGAPAVFTRINSHKDFIQRTTGINFRH